MHKSSLRFTPNALSLSRIVLGLAFPFVPNAIRPWLIGVAAATDVLDGFTARALGMASNTGRLLDPIADKIFVLLIAGTLVVEGAITPWWAAGIAARDIGVLAGSVAVAFSCRRASLAQMWPSWLGKCTTAAQFAVLLAAVIWGHAPTWLLAATTSLSIAAAVHYVVMFSRNPA